MPRGPKTIEEKRATAAARSRRYRERKRKARLKNQSPAPEVQDTEEISPTQGISDGRVSPEVGPYASTLLRLSTSPSVASSYSPARETGPEMNEARASNVSSEGSHHGAYGPNAEDVEASSLLERDSGNENEPFAQGSEVMLTRVNIAPTGGSCYQGDATSPVSSDQNDGKFDDGDGHFGDVESDVDGSSTSSLLSGITPLTMTSAAHPIMEKQSAAGNSMNDGDFMPSSSSASTSSQTSDDDTDDISFIENTEQSLDEPDPDCAARDLATDLIQRVKHSDCMCDDSPGDRPLNGSYSLRAFVNFWRNRITSNLDTGVTCFPLEFDGMIPAQPSGHPTNEVPWEEILAGGGEGENPLPSLSLLESELEEEELRDAPVGRSWDVDSFIAEINGLSAYREGFKLAYRPPYMRSIKQNQRVLIRSRKLHRTRQLRLGTGTSSSTFYNCHVFFPNMPVWNEEVHVSDVFQKEWIDRIVAPSLRLVCPPDVVQHHPVSFQDADNKSKVRRQDFVSGTSAAIDVQYTIPSKYLASF
ncbi:uncharacterized protein BKCO1_670002 [Diplodia corticola]|uniref:Uncharacterized protein n=1 Tax=Diplodia corticola TaxID=236234 RepID=A0A1J9RC61_9PEZI|nr:uncharacterized protein BKCO1_670002 [Diplodia corticola]OJD30059.1 hypothetical protein BKCO1_670002 [Diplodia corticola]